MEIAQAVLEVVLAQVQVQCHCRAEWRAGRTSWTQLVSIGHTEVLRKGLTAVG